MNTTEELLKQAYDALKSHFEPEVANPTTAEAPQKRCKPKLCSEYYYVNDLGKFAYCVKWDNDDVDNYRYSTGNCYQEHEKERAIWEQVTRRKYEQALWEAADWVDGDPWCVNWNTFEKKLTAKYPSYFEYYTDPRFATAQSAIDAHTRILGDDAERYFKGR